MDRTAFFISYPILQYSITPKLPQYIFRTDTDNKVDDKYAFKVI